MDAGFKAKTNLGQHNLYNFRTAKIHSGCEFPHNQSHAMISAAPTRHKAGLTFWGDAWDLRAAHQLIHTFAGDECPFFGSEEEGNFLLGLAYEFRKAYDGHRHTETLCLFDEEKRIYGVDVLWPTALLQVALMRRAASFMPTDAMGQAILYNLEGCVAESLQQTCPSTWKDILDTSAIAAQTPARIIDLLPTRASYFAALPTAAKRQAALPGIMRSFLSGYEASRDWIVQTKPRGWIDPAAFDHVDPHAEIPSFRW